MTWIRNRNVFSAALLQAAVALSVGCDDELCICDAQLYGFAVYIVDDTGSPVEDLDYSVTVNSTGQLISFAGSEAERTGFGHYLIISDLEARQLDLSGDRLDFVASDGHDSVSGEYEVHLPGVCHCHVEKVSGPDTLVLR